MIYNDNIADSADIDKQLDIFTNDIKKLSTDSTNAADLCINQLTDNNPCNFHTYWDDATVDKNTTDDIDSIGNLLKTPTSIFNNSNYKYQSPSYKYQSTDYKYQNPSYKNKYQPNVSTYKVYERNTDEISMTEILDIVDAIDNKVDKISMKTKPDATFYPPDKLNYRDLLLKGFKWQGDKQPKRKEDIMQ